MLRALLLMAMAPVTLFAADPVFSRISPTAVQQGQEVDVTVSGDRLTDLVDIVTSESGISLVSITPPEKNPARSSKLRLKIAADAPLGMHYFRLRTKSGLSNLRSLHVTSVPVALEKETKGGFAEAQPVEMNTAIVGRVDREDVDYYKIALKKGQRFSAEVIGTRLGNSSGDRYFDPYIALLDAARFEVVVSDDEPLTKNDPFFSTIVPEDGEYVIELRDSAYNGDGNSHYVLHVGTFPRPAAVTPLGGRPGETVELTLLGDPSGDKKVKVTLPKEPGDFQYFVKDKQGVSPTPHILKVGESSVVAEVEPNNDIYNQSTAVTLPAAFHGTIAEPNDYDCFKFEAKKNQRFVFTAVARGVRSPLDPVLQMFDVSNKKYISTADDIGNNPDGRLEFRAPHDGTFGVRIYDHLKRGGPEFSYRIEAEAQEPSLKADVVEFLRYFQPRWVVPAGGGIGRRVTVSRRNFSGSVRPKFDNLPAGVRVEMPEVWATSGQVPVVLYADETAPLGHSFTAMNLIKVGEAAVRGLITQKILQVRWRNNDRVVQKLFSELPVAVTEKAPFKVWIEEPKSPAVPDGWLDLTVRCQREEGFEEEVRIEMLMNPPGCSTSRSLRFKKGQDKVTMRVTAGGKARAGRWDVCVRAWANHNGTLETCSPFVPMHVKDRWVDLKFQQAAVEQGQETQVVVDVTGNEAFDGEATVKLLGLPPKTKTEPVTMKAGDKQITFKVVTEAAAPAGTHKSLYCVAEIPLQVGVEPVKETPVELKTVKVAFIDEGDKNKKAEKAKDENKPDEKKQDTKKADEKAKEAEGEKPAATEGQKPAPKPKPIIEIVSHQFRGGKLRIDKPLPPKKDAPAKPKVEKKAAPKPAAKKPLSRLEQLRQAKKNN